MSPWIHERPAPLPPSFLRSDPLLVATYHLHLITQDVLALARHPELHPRHALTAMLVGLADAWVLAADATAAGAADAAERYDMRVVRVAMRQAGVNVVKVLDATCTPAERLRGHPPALERAATRKRMVLACVAQQPGLSTTAIGDRLGMDRCVLEAALFSLLREARVRVELVAHRRPGYFACDLTASLQEATSNA